MGIPSLLWKALVFSFLVYLLFITLVFFSLMGISYFPWKTLVFSFLLLKVFVLYSLLGLVWVFSSCFSGRLGYTLSPLEGFDVLISRLSSLYYLGVLFYLLFGFLWPSCFVKDREDVVVLISPL